MRHSRLVPVFLFGSALVLASCAAQSSLAKIQGPALSPAPKATPTIDALAFLAGDWELDSDKTHVEEHWIQPAGGAMLGVGRTIQGGRMVFFEFLRIETRQDQLVYVAQPLGGTPTPFQLVSVESQRAVFENLKHDFPKRIIYHRQGDGTLAARVEGDGTEKEKPIDYLFKPRAKK